MIRLRRDPLNWWSHWMLHGNPILNSKLKCVCKAWERTTTKNLQSSQWYTPPAHWQEWKLQPEGWTERILNKEKQEWKHTQGEIKKKKKVTDQFSKRLEKDYIPPQTDTNNGYKQWLFTLTMVNVNSCLTSVWYWQQCSHQWALCR